LASGDSSADGKGTLRIWNVASDLSPSALNLPAQDKQEFDSQITSIHWSPTCKELLTTHRPGRSSPDSDPSTQPQPQTNRAAMSIAVHSYPSLRQVVSTHVSSAGIGGSVLSSGGTKVVMVAPGEGKLHVWDVWGKKKEVKRQPSFMDRDTIR
jgi:cell division cycle 20, cofactor of APC complex